MGELLVHKDQGKGSVHGEKCGAMEGEGKKSVGMNMQNKNQSRRREPQVYGLYREGPWVCEHCMPDRD